MLFETGHPKMGGRKKGTPNKDNPIKALLHAHSEDYFAPNIRAEDANIANEAWAQRHAGQMVSQFDIDLQLMRPPDRAKLEIDVLSYHTPRMQSISADMLVNDANHTLADRLARLAAGEEPPAD